MPSKHLTALLPSKSVRTIPVSSNKYRFELYTAIELFLIKSFKEYLSADSNPSVKDGGVQLVEPAGWLFVHNLACISQKESCGMVNPLCTTILSIPNVIKSFA